MNIEVVETTTAETKLTIAKDRVTIKYPVNLASELKERQYRLVLKVVESLQCSDMVTRRGKFLFMPENGKFRITMCIQSKSKGNNVDPITFEEDHAFEPKTGN